MEDQGSFTPRVLGRRFRAGRIYDGQSGHWRVQDYGGISYHHGRRAEVGSRYAVLYLDIVYGLWPRCDGKPRYRTTLQYM